MDHVVHIGIPKAGVDHSPRLGFVIPIGISEEDEFCGATNVCAALHGHHRMRNRQPFSKHSVFVSHSVLVKILEDNNPVIGFIARFNVWVSGRSGYPRPAT